MLWKRCIHAHTGASQRSIADPDAPSLTVLRLVGSEYAEDAHVIGGEAYEADDPFTVRVVPEDLG